MANANLFQAYLQPPKSVADYTEQYARNDALSNQNALQGLAIQQQQATTAQAASDRNALQRVAQASGGDRNAFVQGLRQSGSAALMSQADALEQGGAKLAETNSIAAKNLADAGKTTQGTAIEAHQQRLQKLSMVNTPEDLMQWVIDDAKSDPTQRSRLGGALTAIQTAAQDPSGAAFEKLKTGILQSGQAVQQQLEYTAPKPQEMKLGDRSFFVDVNPNSPTHGQQVTSTQMFGQSPDNVASNGLGYAKLAEDKRHNGVTEGIETTKAATAANGGGKLNEGQGKATTFAARMADAESTIDALEKKGVSGADLRTIAAGNGLTNWAASPDGQDYRQAQENWVTANLRQESGAAIGKDEMDKDVRKFFPAPWDADSVKAQKARARSVAQQGMLVQAGPGATQVPGILQRAGSSTSAPAAAGWSVEVVK